MVKTIELSRSGHQGEHSYALGILRELDRGEELFIFADEDPCLLMNALTLELRNTIYWDIVEAGSPRWRVRVRRREDVKISDLADLLTRDHARIDHLFATALHHINAGHVEAALPSFLEYTQRLRNHIQAENEIIVPVLDLPRSPRGDDPISIMLHEHDEIIDQIVLIEEMLTEDIDDAGMLAPFFAIVSGQLAKHEWREENNLFPVWMRILKQDANIAEELLTKVKQLIRSSDIHH